MFPLSTRRQPGRQAFMIYALLRNNGADSITTAQAKANGAVVAERS